MRMNSRMLQGRADLDLPAPPEITTSALDPATEGEPYAFVLQATGSGITWSLESGTLPDGITLNTGTGALTGTPTESGAFASLVFRATNAGGYDEVILSLEVAASFTPFSDDFSGDLSLWDANGTIAVVTGKAQVGNNVQASIFAADYDMPTSEGSWDFDVTLAWSFIFEDHLAVWCNDTLAGRTNLIAGAAGDVGYVLRITGGAIVLYRINSSATAIKTYTGTVNTGDTVTLRCAIDGSGNRSFQVLVNGADRQTYSENVGDVPAGVGTKLGISMYASSGETADCDDVSFDETA